MLCYSYEQYEEMENERFNGRVTVEDSIREWVYIVGQDSPDTEWFATDYDTWERNPYYTGKPGPHPEDYHYEENEGNVNNIDTSANYVSAEWVDDIPF